MSPEIVYVDIHKDEPILGTCPYCHLPVYQSDPRNQLPPVKGGRPRDFHRGCALLKRGHEYETELTHVVKLLRELGYTVDMKIIRPVV